MPVAVVSPMMGPANEAMTQSLYSHEIQRERRERMRRSGMEAALAVE